MHAAEDTIRRTRPQPDLGPEPDLRLNAATVGCVVGTIAFAVYTRTLLPGVELGDTGGFQAAVLWPETSARQGYPLYYALARPFVLAVSASDPARGLNLFSALCAGAAVGLLAFISGVVVRSAAAGAAAGLLLAFSYTFWSNAVIAEVYALHLALVGVCLIALYAYAARPSRARLIVFFAVFALSFGNHLAMILLLVPFAAFLLQVHPEPRDLLRPRIAALAIGVAAAGALLYLPNFLFVWTNIDAPAAWSDRVAAFWFDATKADWRETMVLGVAGDRLGERLAMWAWDARQQVGLAGLAVAIAGAIRLWSLSRPWAVLVSLAYVISTIFAVTYNVGDTHVFFLPGHYLMAFAAAAALAPRRASAPPEVRRARIRLRQGFGGLAGARSAKAVWARAPHTIIAMLVIVYAGWRAWDTWPGVDRHRDRRADLLVARVAAGVNETNSVLLSDMDWQSENALLYSARYERRDLAWTRLADVMTHLPFLIRDNRAIGRDIVLTADAAAAVLAAYGPLYALIRDDVPAAPPLSDTVERLPRGTPYVLSLLTPQEDPLDAADFDRAVAILAGGPAPSRGEALYQVWAGLVGEPPAYHRAAQRPFRETFALLGDPFTVRMDAWLPFDTFRRGGFGHVLRGREHLLTIERGASLLSFNPDGSTVNVYAAGLYAARPRFRIPASIPQQVAGMGDAMLRRATLP